MDKTNSNISQKIKDLLNSETLKIKALTSAGILTGSVIDIIVDNSVSKSKLETFLDNISNNTEINLNTPTLTYVIKNTYLYPASNFKDKVFLDIAELNSSKIIALCPAFEEAD